MKRAVCALVSGGLDSCVMLGELTGRYRRVYPVFVRHALVWENTELHALRKFLRAAKLPRVKPLTVLELPVRDLYGNHWSTTGRGVPQATTPDGAVHLPGRNLLLLSKATVFCAERGIHTIAVGSLGHNPFPDATATFFREFSKAASNALAFRFQIVTPFRHLTKTQVIQRGRRLGLPLHLTFSCIAPKRGLHCGRCNKCAERQQAFQAAGVSDGTSYAC